MIRRFIGRWICRLTRTCTQCGQKLVPSTSPQDVYGVLSWDTRWLVPQCRDCVKRWLHGYMYGMGPRKVVTLRGFWE